MQCLARALQFKGNCHSCVLANFSYINSISTSQLSNTEWHNLNNCCGADLSPHHYQHASERKLKRTSETVPIRRISPDIWYLYFDRSNISHTNSTFSAVAFIDCIPFLDWDLNWRIFGVISDFWNIYTVSVLWLVVVEISRAFFLQ